MSAQLSGDDRARVSTMPLIAQVAALLGALVHVFFFYLESIAFSRPEAWARFGLSSQEQAEVVRPMALNQGFYNLFLALGIIAGLVLIATGDAPTGRSIVVFACVVMVAAGAVLVTANRAFLRSALIQALPPGIALIAVWLA